MNNFWKHPVAAVSVLVILSGCGGGAVDFKGKGSSTEMSRPATDDVVKNTPAPKTDNVTPALQPDFVVDVTPDEALVQPPTPQVFVPSWGSLQLYSTVSQFEFVESSAQVWISTFVADHADSIHLTSILNILSFVNAER